MKINSLINDEQIAIAKLSLFSFSTGCRGRACLSYMQITRYQKWVQSVRINQTISVINNGIENGKWNSSHRARENLSQVQKALNSIFDIIILRLLTMMRNNVLKGEFSNFVLNIWPQSQSRSQLDVESTYIQH